MKSRAEIESIKRAKKRFRTSLILLGVFLLLLALSITVSILVRDDGAPEKVLPSIREDLGEGIYLNTAVIYPAIEESSIQYISVKNSEGEFELLRNQDLNGAFMLYYVDANGEKQVHYPDIAGEDSSFDYESLYSIEQNDGYNRFYKLSYLCYSLTWAYFDERIELSQDATERVLQLREYGLSEEEAHQITFSYKEKVSDEKDAETVTKTHTIRIGDKNLAGTGFYITVDDRPVIYNATSSYFGYALMGFYSFVSSRLTAEGLKEDNGFEPYLTTNFKQWVNEMHEAEGEVVEEESRVVIFADMQIPLETTRDTAITPANQHGYMSEGYESMLVDLKKMKDVEGYQRLINSIVGKKVGTHYDINNENQPVTDNIIFTLTSDSKAISFDMVITAIDAVITDGGQITEAGYEVGDNNRVKVSYYYKANSSASSQVIYHTELDLTNESYSKAAIAKLRAAKVGALGKDQQVTLPASSLSYEYVITEIESILTDGEDITEKGTPVGDNNLIRVAYYLEIAGTPVSDIQYHAVIDLSEKKLDPTVVSTLRAAEIGYLSGDSVCRFTVNYTEENSTPVNIQCKIVEIIAIYDQSGKAVEKITADSIVVLRYRFLVNGMEQETDYTIALNLKTGEGDEADMGEENFGFAPNIDAIREKLVGKKAARNLSIIAYDYTQYCEFFKDFITYYVAEIRYFVTSELISSFRFQNNSKRDPFYGESLYENTMENKYHAYGLNSSACQEVVKVLGGIGDTTGVAGGLIGSETVAVGLTAENMKRYGLYANTIYFELPRGIIVIDGEEGSAADYETIDDYTWYESLGFTLYISEEQPDGTRYVGSDLYDVIVKVSSDQFVFLKYDFVNFWARRNLMLIDIEAMERFEVDFTMSDIVGGYNFGLSHRDLYIGADNKGYFTEPEEGYSSIYDYISVNVTKDCLCKKRPCVCTKTLLDKYLQDNRYANATLTELYNYTYTGNKDSDIYISRDTYGTSYYKEVMQLLYFTQYEGSLTAEEQEAGLKKENLLMTFKVGLRAGEIANASAYDYVYEFYRIDDRRVMVRLYQAADDGRPVTIPVSDFYVSTFAFKKIVSAFIGLLNAREIDTDAAYPNVAY